MRGLLIWGQPAKKKKKLDQPPASNPTRTTSRPGDWPQKIRPDRAKANAPHPLDGTTIQKPWDESIPQIATNTRLSRFPKVDSNTHMASTAWFQSAIHSMTAQSLPGWQKWIFPFNTRQKTIAQQRALDLPFKNCNFSYQVTLRSS